MILLWLIACLPSNFEITADMYDIEGECWDRDVSVTLEMKYWKEWYLGSGEYCLEQPDLRATFDARCLAYSGCEDRPPLVDEDPNFLASDADRAACNDQFHGDEAEPDCPEPLLTDWP